MAIDLGKILNVNLWGSARPGAPENHVSESGSEIFDAQLKDHVQLSSDVFVNTKTTKGIIDFEGLTKDELFKTVEANMKNETVKKQFEYIDMFIASTKQSKPIA